MLTQTSETAIQALIYLSRREQNSPISPREIAEALDASPTYMAKIARMLVKANILRSHRGAMGGVTLSRRAADINLLEIVEACQGMLIGNYCDSMSGHVEPVCGFHTAMVEIHHATINVLKKWSLEKMATCPKRKAGTGSEPPCKMALALSLELAGINGRK